MLSAGKPVRGSVMATSDAQVSRAQRWIVPRSMPPPRRDVATLNAGATVGAAWALVARVVDRLTAATAAPPARSWRRVATNGLRVRAGSFIVGFLCLAMLLLDAGAGDALDEPALEDEEDDQDGHDHHGRPSQQQAVVWDRLLIL